MISMRWKLMVLLCMPIVKFRENTTARKGLTYSKMTKYIKYLEVEGHYVAYHTSNGIYSEYTTLKKAEKRINRTWFAQCNQSYLQNMKYINSLSRDSVIVDGKEIFISRKMRHSFLAAVAEFLGGKNQ